MSDPAVIWHFFIPQIVKSRFKKVIRKIHLWLGVLSGIPVFIMAISGSIFSFSEEIKSVLYEDRNEIEVPENLQKVPLDQLIQTAQKAFDYRYDYRNIVIPNFPDKTISISFEETKGGKFWYHNYVAFHKTVYLNPYSGKIVKIENTKWEFFHVVLSLHMTLLMGHNAISSAIIITSMWVFVFILISGIILWWPKKKKKIKQSTWFQWKKTTRWKRKNYDLHRILGFYVSFLALILTLTGLLWASSSFNQSVKWFANGLKTMPESELPSPKTSVISDYPFQKIMHFVLQEIPTSKYILIRKHPKETVPYIVRSYVDQTLNFTRIEMFFDKKTASLLSRREFQNKNNGEKVQTLNYDIHTGTIGGLPTKIIVFLSSLFIASLPVTGFMIWLGKRKNRKYKVNP